MSNTSRVDKNLFEETHYLGKPAEADDLIVQRRIEILNGYKDFFNSQYHLIEIGCGGGATLLQLANKFSKATGLEYVEAHKNEFEVLKKKLQVENAEFLPWNIAENKYTPPAERLISFEVIEHLPSDDNVANYANSLSQGALCAITVPNKWWIFETHGAKLPLLPWNRVPFFSWLPTFIHERWANARIYTKKRIIQLLEKHQFEIMDVQYVMAPMDVVKWKPLKNFLRKYIFNSNTTKNPFKAVSIFILAKKK